MYQSYQNQILATDFLNNLFFQIAKLQISDQ